MHQMRRRIASFIEDVYNRQRLHSALDYLTPEEYEKTLSTPSENAAFELMSMELSRNFSVSQGVHSTVPLCEIRTDHQHLVGGLLAQAAIKRRFPAPQHLNSRKPTIWRW
ncbi:IS3 family transposase [Mesorhizobium sp. M0040]|uniref:IS3 family transposase n=1 Tax=Mesorhizobium sp. M0040 TaxID=2956855 RepID=UPI00333ACE50